MRLYIIAYNMVMILLLSTISSCALPKADPSLTGKTYLNEQTQDRMEFTKKGTVVITWSSDEGIWSGDVLFGYPKDYPHEFFYAVYDDGRKMTVLYLSSAQALDFPYKLIEISDSRDGIFVTRMNGRKEEFKRTDLTIRNK